MLISALIVVALLALLWRFPLAAMILNVGVCVFGGIMADTSMALPLALIPALVVIQCIALARGLSIVFKR